jgi:hypothetical protein
LRREYVAARLILIVVGGVALADLARLVVSGIAALVGVGGAGDALAWMGVEVAGLGAATAALTVWLLRFRRQLERVGALPNQMRRPTT